MQAAKYILAYKLVAVKHIICKNLSSEKLYEVFKHLTFLSKKHRIF